MKIQPFPNSLLAIAVIGILTGCSASPAPDTSSVPVPLALPADNTAPTASEVAAHPTEPTAVSTPIPSATDDIWKALDKQSADLQIAIQNGGMKDVPGKANAIRDLTAALPAHASRLSADAQTKLQRDVTLIATYVDKLDAAANAGDQAGAKAQYKKLNDVLGGIARFP
jgi:soluble cytochrome b562